MKIGILGGTFNPIHVAHVRSAEIYAEQLALDQVILVPTYMPPHKTATGLASAENRLAMCRLAVADHPQMAVCDFEISRRETSYTYKTLRYLREQSPDAVFYLMMGADMFFTVQNWRNAEEIFRQVVFCAAARAHGEKQRMQEHERYLKQIGAQCVLVDLEPMPISSTMVREKLRTGGNVTGLLHPDVLAYIREHRLYQE